jgi:hypothetical protein
MGAGIRMEKPEIRPLSARGWSFERPPLGDVIERDLDALLLLEIHASLHFRDFLIHKVTHSREERFCGAWRGVYTHQGESDLLMLSDVENLGRTAILIENKINAPAQPAQAARYHERGREGIRDGHWEKYFVCLCSPAQYLPIDLKRDWHVLLKFEDVVAQLASTALADPRASFLLKALQQGITKFEKGSFRPDLVASGFWAQYQQLCHKKYPDLGMTPLKAMQSRNEPWPKFAAGVLPSDIRLEHKPSRGLVDMTFTGRRAQEVKSKLAPLLKMSLTVERTPPSCALRRQVPIIKPAEPFEEQRAAIIEAFAAAQATLDLWPRVRTLL